MVKTKIRRLRSSLKRSREGPFCDVEVFDYTITDERTTAVLWDRQVIETGVRECA